MKKKPIELWSAVVIWAAIIFYLSSIPGLSSGLEYDFIFRKIAHISEYFILTYLLYRAFKGAFKLNSAMLIVYPTVVTFLYACSDEFHQLFVPGRHGDFVDVLIDCIGILLFYSFLRIKAALKP